MGCYINPTNGQTKEQWLAEHSDGPSTTGKAGIIVNDYYPVCLVDNGAFTAAAVCYNNREIETFKRDDGRRKAWFQVHKDDLYTVSDLARYER